MFLGKHIIMYIAEAARSESFKQGDETIPYVLKDNASHLFEIRSCQEYLQFESSTVLFDKH